MQKPPGRNKTPIATNPRRTKSPPRDASRKSISSTPARVGGTLRQNSPQNTTTATADVLLENVRISLPTGSPLASPVLRTRSAMGQVQKNSPGAVATESRNSGTKPRTNSPLLTRKNSLEALPAAGTSSFTEHLAGTLVEVREQMQEFSARIDSVESQRRELQHVRCMVEDLQSSLEAMRADIDIARLEIGELHVKSSDVQRRVGHNADEMGEIAKRSIEELSLAIARKQENFEASQVRQETSLVSFQDVSSLCHEELADRASRIEQAHLGYGCSLERLERDFRAAEAQASRAMGETSALRDGVRSEIQESIAKESQQRDALLASVRANSRFAIDALRRELMGRFDEEAALQHARIRVTSEASEERFEDLESVSSLIGRRFEDLESVAAECMEDMENKASTLKRRQELICLELQERAHRDAEALQASLCEGSHKLRAELCDALGAHEARCQDALSKRSQELRKRAVAGMSGQEEAASCACASIASSPASGSASVPLPPRVLPTDLPSEKSPAARICD